jgi:hypothetical protein
MQAQEGKTYPAVEGEQSTEPSFGTRLGNLTDRLIVKVKSWRNQNPLWAFGTICVVLAAISVAISIYVVATTRTAIPANATVVATEVDKLDVLCGMAVTAGGQPEDVVMDQCIKAHQLRLNSPPKCTAKATAMVEHSFQYYPTGVVVPTKLGVTDACRDAAGSLYLRETNHSGDPVVPYRRNMP